MTYQQLLDKLLALPIQRLSDSVQVYDSGTGDFIGVQDFLPAGSIPKVLDDNGLYLIMNSNIVIIE